MREELHDRISVLTKEHSQSSLTPSPREVPMTRQCLGARESTLTRRWFFTLDFQPPDCEKWMSVVYKPPSLQWVCSSSWNRLGQTGEAVSDSLLLLSPWLSAAPSAWPMEPEERHSFCPWCCSASDQVGHHNIFSKNPSCSLWPPPGLFSLCREWHKGTFLKPQQGSRMHCGGVSPLGQPEVMDLTIHWQKRPGTSSFITGGQIGVSRDETKRRRKITASPPSFFQKSLWEWPCLRRVLWRIANLGKKH